MEKKLDKGEKRILEYIRKHGSITSMDAFRDLSITRLSARIYDLRAKGYDIKTLKMEISNPDGSHNSYYAKYILSGCE